MSEKVEDRITDPIVMAHYSSRKIERYYLGKALRRLRDAVAGYLQSDEAPPLIPGALVDAQCEAYESLSRYAVKPGEPESCFKEYAPGQFMLIGSKAKDDA